MDAGLPDCVLPAEPVPAGSLPGLLSGCRVRSGFDVVVQYDDNRRKPMPAEAQVVTPPPSVAQIESVAVPVTAAPTAAPAPAVVQVVEVPKLAEPAPSSDSSVVMALIAAAGGGAAWKVYQTLAKGRNATRLKELELESARQEKQHEKCATLHAQLVQRIDELTKRLDDVKQGADAGGGGLDIDMDDFEDMQKRLKKLEAKVRDAKLED